MEAIAFKLAEPKPTRVMRVAVRIVMPIAIDSAEMRGRDVRSTFLPSTSDEELFQQFLAGEERAFTLLFHRHNRKIFYYCAKLLGDSQAAEDITQAMWEKVIEMRGGRRRAEDGTPHATKRGSLHAIRNVPGLLVRIARNLSLDYLKHRRIEAQRGEDATLHAEDAELSEREQIVIECLDAMPLASRELLVLHYYSGYSFEEIAKMLGKKPNAIWTRASRARAELKTAVETRIRAAGRGLL